jgi:hypothetical protein
MLIKKSTAITLIDLQADLNEAQKALKKEHDSIYAEKTAINLKWSYEDYFK